VATDLIKTGDIVRVDGNEGVFKILKRRGEPARQIQT